MKTSRIKAFLVGVAFAAVLVAPAAASAEDYVNNDTPQVQGETQTRGETPAVAPASQSRGASLPITGGDVAGLTAIGAAAVGVGTVMVRRSRRVRTASTNA